MAERMIDEDSDLILYPIHPNDIDANRHFYMAFGQFEVEIVARYVVQFCQKLGGWKAFAKEDLEQFYAEAGGTRNLVLHSLGTNPKFPFYWLNKRLLPRRPDGKYCVTDLFIDRCFASSPKKKL